MSNTFFPPTSRYSSVDTATLKSQQVEIVYLQRRFLPQPNRFHLLQYHTVNQGERLDNITAKYLGDPEQFWRIADANSAMRPEQLSEKIGTKIRITLPEGVPGTPNG